MAVKSTGLSTKGLRSEFFERFNLASKQTYWQKLCTIIQSTSSSEDYRWLGTVPQVREWGSGRKAKGLGVESYNVANLKYEATIEVDRDELSDDQTGQIRIRTQELAQRAATHRDYLLEQLIKNGSSTGYNSYDGTEFFATDHVSGLSGSQANEATCDISAVDVGCNDNPTNPDMSSLRKALGIVLAAMAQFKDDQGEFIRTAPRNIIVCCHYNVFATWNQAINAAVLNNATNTALMPQGGSIEIVPLVDADTADYFHVFDVGNPVKPFIFQDREPLEFDSLEQGSEEGFKTEKYQYGVRARYRLTYGQWRCAYRMQLV